MERCSCLDPMQCDEKMARISPNERKPVKGGKWDLTLWHFWGTLGPFGVVHMYSHHGGIFEIGTLSSPLRTSEK